MKPSIEQALGFRGIEFLEKLFGDGFGMECGLNGPETLIAKASVTASWSRQNTRARGAVHKVANARQAKDDAAKAFKTHRKRNSDGEGALNQRMEQSSVCV